MDLLQNQQLVSVFQVIISLSVLKIWIINFNKPSQWRSGNSKTIYKLFNDYSIYESKKSIFEKIKNKSPKDYYKFFIEYSKRFYIDKIEVNLKNRTTVVLIKIKNIFTMD